MESLTEKISEIDETIPELPPKDLVRQKPRLVNAMYESIKSDTNMLLGLQNLSRYQVLV